MEGWSDPAAPMTSPVIEPPAVRKLESRKCFCSPFVSHLIPKIRSLAKNIYIGFAKRKKI
jgi:hypothetical protein